jgi:hypothetical protein
MNFTEGLRKEIIYIIARKQAIIIAGYHQKGPRITPIKPAYQTSASPSRFMEIKKASKNIRRPIKHPVNELNKAYAPEETNWLNNDTIIALHNNTRDILPVLISCTDITSEKRKKTKYTAILRIIIEL